MNSDNTPLVNRLILLVLSLIFVCLVMLVVRAYQKPLAPDAPPQIAEAQSPPAEEVLAVPVEVTPVRRLEPPRRLAPTNTQRPVAATRPAPPTATAPDADAFATPEPPANTSIAQFDTVVAVRNTDASGNVGGGKAASDQRGEITGYVFLSGTPKPEIPIDMGPTCGIHLSEKRTTRHFVVGPNGGLANVFVYVRGAEHVTARFAEPPEVPLLDQIGCMYEPYVMGVLVGQKFRVRNSDPVLHNVHATPTSNHEFNLGQPLQGQITERSFPKAETFIRIKCDVHPWMFAYISAFSHPFFAVTDTNGFFRLPIGLHSGGYTIVATHLKAGEIATKFNVQENAPNAFKFQFTVQPTVQPQGRIARTE